MDEGLKINTLPRKLPEIDEKLAPPPVRDLPRRVNYRPTQLTPQGQHESFPGVAFSVENARKSGLEN